MGAPDMKLSILSLVVTGDCNFNCRYCKQKKSASFLTVPQITRFLEFCYPLLNRHMTDVLFYGGEPLLAKDQVRASVSYLEEKRRLDGSAYRYTITTNGSLLDDQFIEFMAEHNFIVYLSFDGPAQDRARQGGTHETLRRQIQRLKEFPSIDMALNSVITPGGSAELATVARHYLEMDIPKFRIALDMTESWNRPQLDRLEASYDKARILLGHHFQTTGNTPFLNFQEAPQKDIFCCDGGKDRLALAPGPEVWGCHRVWDYFTGDREAKEAAELSFGTLDACVQSFAGIYESTIKHYSILSHDYAGTPSTDCMYCPEVGECGICPFTAAAYERRLGRIPEWVCRLLKMQRRQRRLFQEEIS
jgi:molybdenum cofactor biosynthesis enzyme MoaA